MKWKRGDRVTRQIFMDDGTWQKEGDKCLENSPLKHGIVWMRTDRREDEVIVLWDDESTGYYLDHGLQKDDTK